MDYFQLRLYRAQWSHLPLVMLPFAGMAGLAAFLTVFGRFLTAEFVSILFSIMGILFAAFVLCLPRIWSKWKNRGEDLRMREGAIELLERSSGRVLAQGKPGTVQYLPGKFHFTVTSRFSGGTYRAPLVTIIFENKKQVHIGAEGSSVEWQGDVPLVSRPDYIIEAHDWVCLIDRLHIPQPLVAVKNARVR